MPDTLSRDTAVLPRHLMVTTSSRPAAEWLVLAYVAADNDLEGDLLADLAEMERVGSSPGVVEILAQVDRSPSGDTSKANWHGTRRYYVTRGRDPRRINSRLVADLGPTNTGDPRVLESFIRFGAQRYPARSTALVLLNHGSGYYVPPEMQRAASEPMAQRRRPPIFHTTRERLRQSVPAERGIAYDDSAADCLDNQELQHVVATAHHLLGRKLDVVGMDACLMTMLEVAYQLRDHAEVLVGSEAVEPGPGWPHASILADLTKNPTMTAPELGTVIVQRYVESYRHGGQEATQSAIDLSRLDELVEAVDQLARRLLAGVHSASLVTSLFVARRRTLDFFEGRYVDLHHLADNVAMATASSGIVDACREIQRLLEGIAVGSPIIAEGHVGASVAWARGLSIYFPLFLGASALYRSLDFASATHWADLLEAFLGYGKEHASR
jgi:hypothetical protein